METALPIYVQEFKIPETVETFPHLLKKGGIMHINIKLTPCIHPVSIAEKITERAALLPVNSKIAAADTVPAAKNTPAHMSGFVSFFIYSFVAA